jgi:hypothetical protein
MVVIGTVDGFSLSVDAKGALHHGVPADPGASYGSPPGAVEWGVWHHVTVTDDGRTAVTYLDGAEIARYVVPGKPAVGGTTLTVGRDPADRRGHLAGTIAHVRVYDGALGPMEIQRDRALDEAALAAFVRAHPVDFDLFNADEQRVLYIDDAPAGQTMTLRIVNTSRNDLELRPAGPEASERDHHVALRFRTGTLAAPPVLRSREWSMLATRDATTVYLLSTAPTVIRASEWIDLELAELRADGAAGTRGTRVELAYRGMGYLGQPDELTGNRLHFLDVVNHQGRPDLPLNVGFVGGDRVLSDGASPSSLRLRIADVSRDAAIKLTGSATAAGAASAFVVSFDVQHPDERREWALTEAGRAGDVSLNLLPGPAAAWDVVREDLVQSLQWTITPRTDTELSPAAPLDLELADIYALASPGHAPIVVAYRNIPGYQDGFASVMAERTPLLFTAREAMIGTATPDARLTVSAEKGHLRLRRESNAAGGGGIMFLDLFQDDMSEAVYPSIGFQQSNRFRHRIEARPEGFYLKTGAQDSQEPADLYVKALHADDLRGGAVHGDSASLGSLKVDGSVGVGTGTVPSRLTVGAVTDHLQLRREAAAPAGNKVLFLELFQTDSEDVVYPCLRFHHSNKFWHRLEGRREGLYLKTGQLDSDLPSDLYVGALRASSYLAVGDVVVGAAELQILRRLAAGQLQFDMLNLEHNEYIYAANFTYDSQRRYVFTSVGKVNGQPERVSQGRWQISFPQ